MTGLSHIDASGAAHMVDVGNKPDSARRAIADGRIDLTPAALVAVRDGNGPKGEVLGTARIAGIMAAKRTAELIPLCHPLPISAVTIDFAVEDSGIAVTAAVSTTGKTGVEMEAMTAACVTLLTIYDMIKAIDKAPVIGAVALRSKTGGKSGDWHRG